MQGLNGSEIGEFAKICLCTSSEPLFKGLFPYQTTVYIDPSWGVFTLDHEWKLLNITVKADLTAGEDLRLNWTTNKPVCLCVFCRWTWISMNC